MPDKMFGNTSIRCPSCSKGEGVKSHGFSKPRRCVSRVSHCMYVGDKGRTLALVWRRVTGLVSDYYVIARRHFCKLCCHKRAKERNTIISQKKKAGVPDYEPCLADYKTKPYTFRSYHPQTLRLLPHGRGSLFPALMLRKYVICYAHTIPLIRKHTYIDCICLLAGVGLTNSLSTSCARSQTLGLSYPYLSPCCSNSKLNVIYVTPLRTCKKSFAFSRHQIERHR